MPSTLFTLLDDVASLLDDVSLMAKVAAKKTAGVLGDDLALNAEQVTGVHADRELPVVWAVFKGSLKNKLILAPSALVISAIAPWMVTPFLMLGGGYLSYEGFEKLAHKFLHDNREADPAAPLESHDHEEDGLIEALADPAVDLVEFEEEKIRGAVRTDFVLSAEIITIALGTVADAPLLERSLVIAVVSIALTVGVYGFVAAVVKMDDLGLYLGRRPGVGLGARCTRGCGRGLLFSAPLLMKGLSIAGTVAMLLVGGGILLHGIPPLGEAVHHLGESGGLVGSVAPMLANGTMGLVSGALILAAVEAVSRLRRRAIA
jgi:predicted DNA repair protein MutK